MLTVTGLTKKYKDKTAIDHFSFKFQEKTYGLLGPNGAGKTTLFRCILLLLQPDSGTISHGEKRIVNSQDYAGLVGYMPQSLGIFKNFTVKDFMQYFAIAKGIDRSQMEQAIFNCLEQVHLSDEINQKTGTLSGGMLRRLGLAQALLGDSPILFLDEPTAGLDPEERIRFKNIISSIQDGRTIVISTHIVEDIEAVCEEVLILREGTLAASGSQKQLCSLADGKVFEARKTDVTHINGEYTIQRSYEKNGETFVRILSGTPQPFSPLEPNLEDGYICCIKKI